MSILGCITGRSGMFGAVVGGVAAAVGGTAFAVEALAAARQERQIHADAARDRDVLRAVHEGQLETLRQANATQVLFAKESAEIKLIMCDQGARTRELMALLRPQVISAGP